jgi:hypothetical protein
VPFLVSVNFWRFPIGSVCFLTVQGATGRGVVSAFRAASQLDRWRRSQYHGEAEQRE